MTYSAHGIILRRRDYGEHERLSTIYTREYGKIEAAAQGIRKIKSKLAGHTEPLTYGEFMFANGRRTERLIQARTLQYFSSLREDLAVQMSAFFMAEAVDLLTRAGERDLRIFDLLLNTLTAADAGQKDTFSSVVKLLHLSGFGLSLDTCVSCKRGNSPALAVDFVQGGVLCESCAQSAEQGVSVSRAALDFFRVIFSSPVSALPLQNNSEILSLELQRLALLYLRAHAPYEPKVAKFFMQEGTLFTQESPYLSGKTVMAPLN
ncbi:MAG: DNA repair protein RecO [Patescibacteria group bacterium]